MPPPVLIPEGISSPGRILCTASRDVIKSRCSFRSMGIPSPWGPPVRGDPSPGTPARAQGGPEQPRCSLRSARLGMSPFPWQREGCKKIKKLKKFKNPAGKELREWEMGAGSRAGLGGSVSRGGPTGTSRPGGCSERGHHRDPAATHREGPGSIRATAGAGHSHGHPSETHPAGGTALAAQHPLHNLSRSLSPATAEWQSPRVLPDTGTALTPSRAVLTPQRSQILLQQQPKGSFLSPELLAAVLIILMEHLF